MSFRLHKDSRDWFSAIVNSNISDGSKLKYLFDEYYLCLLVGFAKGRYSSNAEYENGEFVDHYPNEYSDSINYIAGLLIATEKKHRGILEEDATSLEKLMVELIDPTSHSRLTDKGHKRLNQYAALGFETLREEMISKHTNLTEFLLDYMNWFDTVQVES